VLSAKRKDRKEKDDKSMDDDDIIIVYFPKQVQNNAATKENECLKHKDNSTGNSTVLPWARRRH
jgi:hypothetical protein